MFAAIPYFGPAIIITALFTIGFLQFGTILMGLYVAGLAFLIVSLEGLLLKPWLTMRAARMNGVALFLGLMFWGWLWGFWGLLLAVPMMVIIKSISDRIEALNPSASCLEPDRREVSGHGGSKCPVRVAEMGSGLS